MEYAYGLQMNTMIMRQRQPKTKKNNITYYNIE